MSGVQCLADDDSIFNLDYVAMADSADDSGIDPDQQVMMDELVDTTRSTIRMTNYLCFPHMVMYLSSQ